MQKKLYEATLYALAAVAADVRQGLLETVGLESEWQTDSKERASVVIYLPPTADAEYVARAVNLENLEAWLDEKNRFHVAIGPYYMTKDVDQVVLCTIKVVHQYTGLIGIDEKTHGHSHSYSD